MRRLLEAGYRNIYLNTEDWRLPALSIYLKLGWVPLLYMSDMEERWRDVCAKIDWPFTPQGVARGPCVACLNPCAYHGAVGGIAIMAGSPNSGHIDLRERGIDECLAAELRARFATFAEDWDAPEMEIYDGWETGDTDSASSRRGSRMITGQPAEVDEVQEIKKVLSETWIDTYGPFLPAEVIEKVTTLWHRPGNSGR